MKFKRDVLIRLAYEDFDDDNFMVMQNNLEEDGRWVLGYNLVFKYKGNFYQTSYNRGANEMQDEQPFEYDPDEIECPQVWPYLRVITEYRESKPDRSQITTGDEYHAIN